MLLYRPLIAAYRQTTVASARRFLLREFADPQLHAEPDELLRELDKHKEVGLLDEPGRLSAEVNLRERLLKLRLTTRDPARAMGGMWTMHSANQSLGAWVRGEVSVPKLATAAGSWIGQPGEALVRTLPGDERARVLCSLGEVGAQISLETLREELMEGSMPAAAAVGLSRLPGEEGHAALLPAVQKRGLNQCASWLGIALSRMASKTTMPLVTRMARAEDRDMREQAAWAVGSFFAHEPLELIGMFSGEKDPFVRLHLLGSIGRLGVPGGLATLRKFSLANDPTLLRTGALKAASRSKDAAVRVFLEEGLKSKDPEVIAEALQALVGMGIPGEPYLPIARQAAEAKHGRLMLIGLLALSIWAPAEAFAKVRDTFAGAPSSQWFLAAYVMRYLRTDQTVPLLKQLCTAAHGSDLEEIAVSSLCRYLDDPAALSTLLELAKAGTAPIVLHRMMQDIARHLPPQRASEASSEIRGLLKPDMDPAYAGPLLVALGSLGGWEDIPALASHMKGPNAVEAIHGIELINDPEAANLLEDVAKGPASPASEAATVALFRLGIKSAATHLERFGDSGDDTMSAGRVFYDMALSVRCIRETSRLSRLYDALSEIVKTLPPEVAKDGRPKPVLAAGGQAGDVDLVSEAMASAEDAVRPPPDFQQVLTTRRKTVKGVPVLAINQSRAAGNASAVYKDLGKHMKDLGPEDTGKVNPAKVLGGLTLVLLLVSGLASYRAYMQKMEGPHAIEASRLANFPPVYREGGDPEAGEIKVGDTVQGTREKPLKLVNRIPANRAAATGRLKIEAVTFPSTLPLRCELTARLLDGAVEVYWPRGTAGIIVEGARTKVEVEGHARLDLLGSTFQLIVISGEARTLREKMVMKTITAGQGGEFLDGNPAGRIEDINPPASMLSLPSPSPAPSAAP